MPVKPDEYPLTSWTFQSNHKGNRLHYCPTRVRVDVVALGTSVSHSQVDTVEWNTFKTIQTKTYTPTEVFESHQPIASLQVEHQLLKMMALTIDEHGIDRRRWLFWQHFDNDTISEQRLDAGDRTCLEITRWGTWLHENRRRRSTIGVNPLQRRFDQCFFNGPVAVGLSFSQRTDLRWMLLKALGTDTTLSLGDAFPLFDYELTPECQEWREEDGYSGASLKLCSDRVIISGWDNPRDGGASTCSIENFWTNPRAILERLSVSRFLSQHIPRAMQLLKPAIKDPLQ